MKLTKIMIVAALAAGVLTAGSSSLRAQDSTNTPAAGEHNMKGMRHDMAAELNLTDDQKAKVKTIMEDQMKKMRDVRKDDGLSSEDKRTKMKAIHDDTATQLKAVLTPEQFTKWQDMTKKMHHKAPPEAPSAPPQS